MFEITELRKRLERAKGEAQKLEKNIRQTTEDLQHNRKSLRRHEQALIIIREAGLKTQQQLQFHISDITSLALDAVFDDPYELVAEFVERRNQSECDLLFVRKGNRIDPITASGGGTVDVAAFALRVASWSMKHPHSAPVLLLDEPFKHLRGEVENEKVLQMVQEITRKLNVQVIMVGDVKVPREVLLANADRVFEVSIKNGVSKVFQVSQ